MTIPSEKTGEAAAVGDLSLVLRAMRQAVREALAQHRQAGDPIVVWRDGRVVWIPAAEIPVDLTAPLAEHE